METNQWLELLDSKEFLDKIYRFSYHRCNTSIEAEDLCSDIILAVISAMHKQECIENFYAFVWTIARRVYADYCQNRNAERQVMSIEKNDLSISYEENEIDKLIENAAEREQISKIFKEIAFLSKAYREVMVMFYIDELKVKDIAAKLNIHETTVKQRLFSARKSVRKEVETMSEKTYVLKPIKLAILGTGNPCGNDPRSKTERVFSQNLIYLCKGKPKSAKELSEALCVPMPYIEEELEIQCHGENGNYGMLRKLDNGKYTINIHLADYDEYDQVNKIYEKHLPEFCRIIKNTLKQNKEKIFSFPYLSEQKDLRFIMWSLISRIVWDFKEKINKVLAEKYFSDVTPIQRNFFCAGVAYTDEQNPSFDFYGCDGIDATSLSGYKSVFVSNVYGKRIEAHFHCGHNLSHDPKLLMVLKAIGGIAVDELSEAEKEIAAKALACGYLRKKGNLIEPKMIVIDRKNDKDFFNLSFDFNHEMGTVIEQIAAELSVFMRSHIPEHLLNEYPIYTELIAGSKTLSKVIEKCISEDLLTEPENEGGAEGMLMMVEK
ncbi:MAG: RNA polymerase sigma factor [Clostridiales bacterium]|nr:RNA polymerase sigma factor [Clostridiales bacterium]